MTLPRNGAEDAVIAQMDADAKAQQALDERMAQTVVFENGKVNWRNKVAADADTLRSQKDAEFFGTEAETFSDESIAESNTEEQDEEQVEQVDVEDDETDGSILVTKTINGKKVTKTVDEWITLASKVENADAYYSEAARRLQEVNKPPVKKTDVRELAKRIQLGSEDDAAAALEEVLVTASQNVKEEKQAADTQAAGRAVYTTFARDYADIVGDPVLNGALNDMDQRLMNKQFDADPVVNFDKRLRHCGDAIRKWKNNVADTTVKNEKRQALVKKKEQIVNLNTASQKQSSQSEKVLSEKEAKAQAVASMFASRKKKAF